MLIKNNFYCPKMLLFFVLVISTLSCKKEEPPKFSGDSFLYFTNVGFSFNPDLSIINLAYLPEQTFSSFITWFQKDTMVLETDFGAISIQSDGKLKGENRKISLVMEGDGKEFAIIPHPDSIYIPANGIEYKLSLKLLRPPLSDMSVKTLTLMLKNNDAFSPEKHSWSKITYKFGNLLTPTRFYPDVEKLYGNFSSAKMYALQYAVERAGANFWNTDPNVITLNNFLKLRDQRMVKFDRFSFDELYYFMDMVSFLNGAAPSGPIRNAYNALTDTVITLADIYVAEQKAEGKPILDESKKEISFP